MKYLLPTILAATLLGGTALTAKAVIMVGDIAIIGLVDNGTPDRFAFVNLAPIAPGEDIYFTDNGWTGTQFRSTTGTTDGDGSEGLIKWTANTNIPVGQIIQSPAIGGTTPVSETTVNGGVYTWTRTQTVALGGTGIPGATGGGNFTDLSFSNPADQIYAFQASINNPLYNPTVHLFVFDDSGTFEAAVDNNTGTFTPGLTPGQTALTFPFGATSRFMAFNTNTLASGTKSQWLSAIATQSNWITGAAGNLPSGSIVVVPEPTIATALVGGAALLFAARRRKFCTASEA